MQKPNLTFKEIPGTDMLRGSCDHPNCRYGGKNGAKPDYTCFSGAKTTESLLSAGTDLPPCSGSSGNWHPLLTKRDIPGTGKIKEINYWAEMLSNNEVR